MHVPIKEITNWHTPIEDLIKMICDEVKHVQEECEMQINFQRSCLPWMMDRKAFVKIGFFVMHQCINIVMRQFNAAKKWVERVDNQEFDNQTLDIEKIAPPNDTCVLDCGLPIRFGLLCRCWLYQCVTFDIPISLSFIHPRWLLDGPEYVPAT